MNVFAIQNSVLEERFSPTFYLFKEKIKSLSNKKDIFSFNLGDKGVLEVITDGEHAGQKFLEEGITFIKNSSVKRFNINELDGFYISREKNEKLKRSQLKKDDVLFSTIGNLGFSAVVSKNLENSNINQNLVRIRINPEKTTPQYLCCFLNSNIARFQIENLFTGNIYPILTYPKIKTIRVFINGKEIVKKVTDNIINAENYHIKSMELINKAKDIFLKSLGVDFSNIKKKIFFGVSYKELIKNEMWTPFYYYPLFVNTIKEVKNKNNTLFLGDIVEKFIQGEEVGSENYKNYLDKQDSDLPFVRTSDLVNYDVDLLPDYYIDENIGNELKQNIEENEILFTKDGKIGFTAITTKSDNCILGSGILRIKPNKVNPYYLFIALSTKEIGYYQALQRTVIASTIPHLRKERMEDFVIPIIKNQKEIIKFTQEAFVLKEKRKKLIIESKRLLERSLNF
jgi:type I restriction enzyme, S subunit